MSKTSRQKNSQLISIAIPTLNEEKFIARALRCLSRQTYRRFEVIVVDGGHAGPSKDHTVETARKFGAKVLVAAQGGVADARNLAYSIALGKIIIFTEADVRAPPTWLENVKKQFDDDTIAIAGPGIPEDATPLVQLEYSIYNALRFILSRLPRPAKHLSASAYNFAVRKDVFQRVGGFNALYPANDDGLLSRKVAMIGRTKFCPDTYVFISARRFNSMGFLRANLHYIYVLENFLNFLEPFLQPLRRRSARSFQARLGVG